MASSFIQAREQRDLEIQESDALFSELQEYKAALQVRCGLMGVSHAQQDDLTEVATHLSTWYMH